MLSRSNSNAGDRLRRAKSISSAHTSSSGHQRQTTSIDPFNSRLHAEAAAIEAYERARQSDEVSHRPRPQRRRSQISGKSEGGHFEDARKRALSRLNEASKPSHVQVQHTNISRPSTAASGEERVITRKRSVIPPLTDPGRTHFEQRSSTSTSERRGRRRQSTLGDGSPAPRYSLTPQEQETTLQLPNIANTRADDHSCRLTRIAEYIGTPRSRAQTPRHSRPSTHGTTQASEEALDQARDRCLQDFQTKRVRERKSFILAPFQKRRTHNVGGNFDNSLPPFNYAENDDAAPLPQHPMGPPLALKTEHKTRNLSDTLKGRLKKVFRKSSRAASEVPPQHVEAPEFHFTVRDTDLSEIDDTFVDYADPFMTIAAEDPSQQQGSRLHSMRPKSASGENDTLKSRVTSWTNSTVAGMSTIRTDNGPFAAADETARSRQADGLKTLRKASSFWGRPIQNKLRRTSKADLKSSEESQGLYDALQKRLRPSRSMDPTHETMLDSPREEPPTQNPSTLASLPSQRDYSSSQASRTSSTIRAVGTQDPATCGVNVPSPVKEDFGPDPDGDLDDTVTTYRIDDDSRKSTPRSDLKRRPAIKAQPPSQEQLSKRLERSKNRWRSPLDELSSHAGHPTKASTMDDNPYELRSLSHAARQTISGTDLPHHTRIRDGGHAVRASALSPSVYSRATDGASPRPLTPEDFGMTTITVTGREVRRYDISPAKPDQGDRRHGSREWRKWLSDEMNNFGSGKNELDLAARAHVDSASSRPGQHFAAARPRSDTASPECLPRPGSVSPALWEGSVEAKMCRPRAGSNASSFMNERYPNIEASRQSSHRSVATARQTSRPGSADPRHSSTSRAGSHKPSTETLHQAYTKARERAFSTESIAEHDVVSLITSTLANQHVREPALTSNSVENVGSGRVSAASIQGPGSKMSKTVNRPKSAYELRANYRNAASGKAKQLEVRRKAIESNLLEDNTIRNISAGPYASQRLDSPNQENTRPLESPLPAVSSSEWLAAGTKSKKEVRKASSMHPLARPTSRSSPNYSPKRSPGQRMVTNWLDERKSKENMPAFV